MKLIEILSNPNFEPPEIILELNLNNGLKGLLESPKVGKKTLVRFSIGEAELVLPLFEEVYPSDDRPRKAIQAAREWLVNPKIDTAEAAEAARAAAAARVAAWAADTAWAAASAAAYYAAWGASAADAAWAAAWAAAGAREADPSVIREDQILRFLELLKLEG